MSTLLRYGGIVQRPSESKIEAQEDCVLALAQELKALGIALRFLQATIRSKTVNLQQMKEALRRMKVSRKEEREYRDYKVKLGALKEQDKERRMQEEINDMKLKGII